MYLNRNCKIICGRILRVNSLEDEKEENLEVRDSYLEEKSEKFLR